MPKYLRLRPERKDAFAISVREIFKVYKWSYGYAQMQPDNEYDLLNNSEFDFEPATESEYLAYLKSTSNATK